MMAVEESGALGGTILLPQLLKLLRTGQLGPMFEEARRRGGDLIIPLQRLGEQLGIALHADLRIAREAGRLEQGGNHLRLVGGRKPERIAWLIFEARAGQV